MKDLLQMYFFFLQSLNDTKTASCSGTCNALQNIYYCVNEMKIKNLQN